MHTTFVKFSTTYLESITRKQIFFTAALVLPLMYFRIKKKRKKDDSKQLKRNISFTSAAMAMGSWPEEKNVCDPIINIALVFPSIKECPTEESLVSDVIPVMLQYERCAGVPRGTAGKNNWSFHPSDIIDAKKLVRTIEIEGDDSLLYKVSSDHMNDDLRNGRDDLPWWEYLIIKNKGSGMSACILRMEHTIADGLSLVHLFEQFITFEDGKPVDSLIPKRMGKKFQIKQSKITLVRKTIKAIINALTLPTSRFDDGVFFRRGTGPDMVYTGNRSPLIFPTIPLDFIKDLKNKSAVTVNDVFLACLSQALYDYCLHQKCAVLPKNGNDTQFRAFLPLAFPRSKDEIEDKSRTLSNKWVFISADMGIGYDNIFDRLAFVHKNMNKIKQSPLAYCTRQIQEIIGPKLPSKLRKQTVFDSFCRHSLVFSNVPGPDRQCIFAGKKIAGCQMLFNNLIPQVGILTYFGQVFMNMIIDPDVVVESQMIPIFYCRALCDLAKKYDVEIPEKVLEYSKE